MAPASDIESVWKTINTDRRPGDVPKLIEIACRNMEVLEPWNHATSEHPDAMALIERAQDLLASFVKALKRSKDVAKNGFKISEDMIHLCDHLADTEHVRSADIEGFIDDMMPTTKDMIKESKRVREKFSDVRKELALITRDIPEEVVKIQEDHKDKVKKLEAAVKHGDRVQTAKFVGAAVGTAAVAVAGVFFAPALIFLPVALPIIHLVSKMMDNKVSKRIEERQIQTQNCEEALDALKKMSEDLAQLNLCIDEFAAFWTNNEMLLGVLTGRIRDLRKTHSLNLRLKTVKSGWVDIKDSFEIYAAKIELICQLATPPAKQLPSADSKGDKLSRAPSGKKGQVLKKSRR